MVRECIILAGGLGTRLRSEVPDVPKVLAPVAGRPFLSYVFKWLERNGINRAILSLGYHAEEVVSWCRTYHGNIDPVFSIEEQPLGTGGAISLAMCQVQSDKVFVTNGDTFFDVQLNLMEKYHVKHNAEVTIALKKMTDFNRYGTVRLNESGRVEGFEEKGFREKGLINGGVYLINRDSLRSQKDAVPYSFEKDFLEKNARQLVMSGFICDNYFIDIGIPEDYRRAQTELPDAV